MISFQLRFKGRFNFFFWRGGGGNICQLKPHCKTNLNSCIRFLGNQDYKRNQGVHHFSGNQHWDHKGENSQGWPLKSETKNDFQCLNFRPYHWSANEKKFTRAFSTISLISTKAATDIRPFSVGTKGVGVTFICFIIGALIFILKGVKEIKTYPRQLIVLNWEKHIRKVSLHQTIKH